jgi:hypothetical protein
MVHNGKHLSRHALTLALASFSICASLPAKAQDVVDAAECGNVNLAIKLISLSRSGAGKLTLVLEYENSSNFSLKPFQPDYGKGTLLVDDQGDSWQMLGMGGSVYNGKVLMPGVKTKLTYGFTKASGGNEATKANAKVLLSLMPLDKGGPSGKCEFTLKNVPIKS